MSNSRNWRNVAEFVGLVALVVSLVFVGLQMRQTNDVAYMELDTTMVGIMAETADLVAANAEVWVKGNAGETLNATESAIYGELINVINTRRVVAEAQARQLGRGDISTLIRRDWAAFLHQNPGARKVWQAKEENLIEYRRLIAPDDADFSGWRDDVLADLAILDAAVN